MQEAKERCEDLEGELAFAREHSAALEAQLASTQDQVLDLERSKGIIESASAERLSQLTQLQRRVEEGRVREGLVGELREQVNSLEQRLTRLQSEVYTNTLVIVCVLCLFVIW